MGEGTFGRCYQVTRNTDGRQLALKAVRRVARLTRAAQVEAITLEQLHAKGSNDPNRAHIVELVEHFHYEGGYCLVFEKLGRSLYDTLSHSGYQGLSIHRIRPILKSALQGLDYLQTHGLTHTDLKPENLLESGEGVKIADFGGATWDKEEKHSLINTRQYRAPEVIFQCMQWNHKSDIWGLGVLTVELLKGSLYFPAKDDFESMALINEHAKVCYQKYKNGVKSIPIFMFQCSANQGIQHYCSPDYKAYNKSLDIYDYFLFDRHASEKQKAKRKSFRNIR